MTDQEGLDALALLRPRMVVAGRTCGATSAEVALSVLEARGGSGYERSQHLTSNTRRQRAEGVLVLGLERVTHEEPPEHWRCLVHRSPGDAALALGPALFAAESVQTRLAVSAATRLDALDSCLYRARRQQRSLGG